MFQNGVAATQVCENAETNILELALSFKNNKAALKGHKSNSQWAGLIKMSVSILIILRLLVVSVA